MAGLTTVLGPAAFAGLVAVGATVAIERLGGRVGGVVGSMPTTIVPASWGILAASADADAFRDAMAAVPVGMAVDGLFLWTWRALPGRLSPGPVERRLAVMVAASLGLWLLAAAASVAALVRLERVGLSPVEAGGLATGGLVVAGLLACWRPPPAPRAARPVAAHLLAARGLFAAAAIAACVAIAAGGAPLAAGLASVFPAIFLTTMVSLWLAQGEAVPVGAAGPMILGSTSVCAYALLAGVLLPAWGPIAGAAASWIGAVLLTSLPASAWLAWRRDAIA